jgi:hypothetical protein
MAKAYTQLVRLMQVPLGDIRAAETLAHQLLRTLQDPAERQRQYKLHHRPVTEDYSAVWIMLSLEFTTVHSPVHGRPFEWAAIQPVFRALLPHTWKAATTAASSAAGTDRGPAAAFAQAQKRRRPTTSSLPRSFTQSPRSFTQSPRDADGVVVTLRTRAWPAFRCVVFVRLRTDKRAHAEFCVRHMDLPYHVVEQLRARKTPAEMQGSRLRLRFALNTQRRLHDTGVYDVCVYAEHCPSLLCIRATCDVGVARHAVQVKATATDWNGTSVPLFT